GGKARREHMPSDLQECEFLIGTIQKRGADGAVRHRYDPVFTLQEIEHAPRKVGDGRIHRRVADHVPGDGESEEDAEILIARRVADPEVAFAVRDAGINAVALFFAQSARSVSRIGWNGAAREERGSGNVHQRPESLERGPGIGKSIGIVRYAITESFGGKIMP